MQKTFFFNNSLSPTVIQLSRYLQAAGWQINANTADLSDVHLDYPQLEHLEYKHLLAQFLEPDLLWMMPKTVCLDENNWAKQLDILLKKNGAQTPWILKPALLNNGQHIHLFSDLTQVFKHYAQAKRLGGPHVLQQYIQFPHLLKGPEKGHKYSIRMFMGLKNQCAFLYPKGYFNIALTPYVAHNLSLLTAHLTNEHLGHGTRNVAQIPTSQYPIFNVFYPQIVKICKALAQKFLTVMGDMTSKFALLGIDLMVDSQEQLWLLEVNHGPCFPTDEAHPLYFKLYDNFWRALVCEILENNEVSNFLVL